MTAEEGLGRLLVSVENAVSYGDLFGPGLFGSFAGNALHGWTLGAPGGQGPVAIPDSRQDRWEPARIA